jgi:hypothetical protein
MNVEIPSNVDDNETIWRTLYSPHHINRRTNKVRPSAVQPSTKHRDEEDETKRSNKVSVTRRNFVSEQFCVQHALSNASDTKTFEGFLDLKVESVRAAGADVCASPTDDNPAHANIVYNCLCVDFDDEIDDLNDQQVKQIQRRIVDAGTFIPKTNKDNSNN